MRYRIQSNQFTTEVKKSCLVMFVCSEFLSHEILYHVICAFDTCIKRLLTYLFTYLLNSFIHYLLSYKLTYFYRI